MLSQKTCQKAVPYIQAAMDLVARIEGQEDCLEPTRQKVGLARALFQAKSLLPQLFQEQPQVLLANLC